jgi:hypothetical protein
VVFRPRYIRVNLKSSVSPSAKRANQMKWIWFRHERTDPASRFEEVKPARCVSAYGAAID